MKGIAGASIYMDDIQTGAPSLEAMEDQWREILTRCRSRGTKLNPDKTFLFRRSLDLLGHRVEAGRGYTVIPSRAKDILDMSEPTDVEELQKIIGIFSYVAETIPNFAHRVAPLRALLVRCTRADLGRKGGRRPSKAFFPLAEPERRAFQGLRDTMQDPQFLAPFVPGRMAFLVCDASQVAVAGVLYQLHSGAPRMVALFSKALQDAQTRWPVFDLEAFAVVEALKRWRHLLLGTKVVVVSDHKGLTCLFKDQPRLTGKSARWTAVLLEFDVELRHVAGTSSTVALADYLSRDPAATQSATLISRWREGTVLAERTPGPVKVRRLQTTAIAEWARRAQARRLRTTVRGTLPQRMADVLANMEGSIPYDEYRRRWLALGQHELGVAPMTQVRAMRSTAEAQSVGEEAWVERVRKAQLGNPLWGVVGKVPDVEEVNGVLLRGGKIVLPLHHPMVSDVFAAAHDSSLAGHRSGPATLQRMTESIWAPGLAAWVTQRIRTCETCVRAKHATSRKFTMLAIDTQARPFHTIQVDGLLGLPASEGFDKLWVGVDRFTHFIFLIPAKQTDDAEQTAVRLLDGMFCYFGLPAELITDQDPLFTAAFTRALHKLLKITHNFTVARRKQAGGLVERQMRTIREYLRMFCKDNADDWAALVPAARFAFNSAINAATGVSPLHLILGRPPVGPWTLPTGAMSESPAASVFFERRARVQREAAERLFDQQVKMVQRANLTRVDPKDIREGDQVFVSAEALPDPRESHRPEKLRSAFSGPYKVLETSIGKMGRNVRIQLPRPPFRKDQMVLNVDSLKIFVGQTLGPGVSGAAESSRNSSEREGSCVTSESSAYTRNGPVDRIAGEEEELPDLEEDEFLVDSLLDHRGGPDGVEY